MAGRRIADEDDEGVRSLTEALAEDFDEDPDAIAREAEAFEMSEPWASDIVETD